MIVYVSQVEANSRTLGRKGYYETDSLNPRIANSDLYFRGNIRPKPISHLFITIGELEAKNLVTKNTNDVKALYGMEQISGRGKRSNSIIHEECAGLTTQALGNAIHQHYLIGFDPYKGNNSLDALAAIFTSPSSYNKTQALWQGYGGKGEYPREYPRTTSDSYIASKYSIQLALYSQAMVGFERAFSLLSSATKSEKLLLIL